MGTLLNIDDACDVLYLRYVSEPILSEAASFFMSNDLLEILENLNKVISTTAVVSTGLVGELAAEIILLAAKNKACIKVNNKLEAPFSRPVTVGDFLESLLGITHEKYQELFDQNHLKSKFLKVYSILSY